MPQRSKASRTIAKSPSATAARKSDAGSIVKYAKKVAADTKRSREVAHKANIVTKDGRLTAHYR